MKIINPKELYSNLQSNLAKILSVETHHIIIKVFENSSGVQHTLDEFINSYNPEEIGKGQCNLIFRIDVGETALCSFKMRDMYDCCGIIVASDLYVAEKYRQKGIGTLIMKFVVDFSTYYGYGVIQATDKKENENQVKIFERTGFKKSHEFLNPKTKSKLIMWIYNVNL